MIINFTTPRGLTLPSQQCSVKKVYGSGLIRNTSYLRSITGDSEETMQPIGNKETFWPDTGQEVERSTGGGFRCTEPPNAVWNSPI